MICRSFINKTLIHFADYDNMLLFNFCSGSIVMNAMRFYFKTTSKIVLTILFLTKKLRELDLAQPGKKHSVNSSEYRPNSLVNVSVNFRALDMTQKVMC